MLVQLLRKLVEKREALGVLFAAGSIPAVAGSIPRKVGTIPGGGWQYSGSSWENSPPLPLFLLSNSVQQPFKNKKGSGQMPRTFTV
ncbi:hypothetical protein C6Y45_14035 [Alkalicoccus saliphilus]|uniref:Uncharacterized protein n=2 Tax=Alkalicoccus saliphilus TaxID=200989 RepID=A0A2T4U3E6_9BACI|nr:hypothetical protein C6Y45_14035 [Alkalicoccus saliphilus]